MKTKLEELFIERKTKQPIHLLVAGAEDISVLKAVEKANQDGNVIPKLLGDKKKIELLIKNHKVVFNNDEIIEMKSHFQEVVVWKNPSKCVRLAPKRTLQFC